MEGAPASGTYEVVKAYPENPAEGKQFLRGTFVDISVEGENVIITDLVSGKKLRVETEALMSIIEEFFAFKRPRE